MTDRPKFEEIDVERINIVEADGTLRMSLANGARLPDPDFPGKPYDRQGQRGAGMIFFNDHGVECGGLAFEGKEADGVRKAIGHLSFDRYLQDQVVTMGYGETADGYYSGFTIQERPEKNLAETIADVGRAAALDDEAERASRMQELGAESAMRIAIARSQNGEAAVYLMDTRGRPRIRMCVDPSDEPMIQFLDGEGNVTYSLPPKD